MHKIFSFALIMTFVLLPVAKSYALSDDEYHNLMEAPQFRSADHELTKYWKNIYKNLSHTDKQFILSSQREWLQSQRDSQAEKLQSLGIKKGDAYTIATFMRIGELWVYRLNSSLSDKQEAKDSTYYDYDMIRHAVKVIKASGSNIHLTIEQIKSALRDYPSASEMLSPDTIDNYANVIDKASNQPLVSASSARKYTEDLNRSNHTTSSTVQWNNPAPVTDHQEIIAILTNRYGIACILLVLMTVFSAFKIRQAKGQAMVHDIAIDLGEGSFLGMLWIKCKVIFWMILTLAFGCAAFFCFILANGALQK